MMGRSRIPEPNITIETPVEFMGDHLVLFRQGSKLVFAPFATAEEAEEHAAFLRTKWGAEQIYILRNAQ